MTENTNTSANENLEWSAQRLLQTPSLILETPYLPKKRFLKTVEPVIVFLSYKKGYLAYEIAESLNKYFHFPENNSILEDDVLIFLNEIANDPAFKDHAN